MRSTVWVGGLAALFLPFAAVEAQESSDSDGVRHVGKIHNRLRAAEARQEYFLDQEFDDASRRYARAKKEIQKSTGIFYSMTSSVLSQWGAPGSDYGAVQAQFSPSVNWRAFRDPELGAGSFQFAYLATQYWSGQTGTSLQNRLGLNSPVNDYPVNQLTFAQVSYTHDFPGHFVSVTLGQFPFSNFDGNAYANNEQVNFIGYSLAQNGSQNYSQGSLGAYVQLNPTQEITLAAGLQDANNVLASNYIQLNTAAQGQYSWFVYGAWSPLSGMLRNGSYSLFYYNLPSVEMQPQASSGLSFNASQPLGKNWGLFARANTAWNSSQYIQSSIAGGAVYNNPLGRAPLDQIGLGIAWNRVNQALYANTYVNPSETMVELYWSWSVKHLLITPDVQLYFQPALAPTQSMAAVFSLRVTVLF
ncbi:carbohydrate porin [uncultured Reyranella sp.]|uniref:carbohydrate porin n=1 Tax=uncultured Reyranella sp. TaxID=735512 RepID=UPI0025D8577A|nr:carbohydrate porin [uncultured Reyranella sp.]